MQAVILSRVSSEEQKQGFSPEAQLTNARRYQKALKMDLIKEFYFDESASYSKPNSKRTKFWEVINYIKDQYKNTGQRIALIADVVDRLQRGFRELNTLEDMINDGVVELHFVEDKLVVNLENIEDTGGNWESKILEAKNYIRKLRKNVKRGMRGAREEGVVFKLPEGYIRKNGEVTLSNNSDLISEAFDLFSSGRYIQVEIVKQLNEKGFKTTKGAKLSNQTLNKILKNPFYYGIAKSKYGNFSHIYQPLTTKTIFDKCQTILDQNLKSNKKQKRGFRPYSFRNILTCSCGRTINPYTAKIRYNYYRCVNNECEYYQQVIKEEILLKQAENILKGLVFSNEAVNFIVDKLKADFNHESLYQKQKRVEIYKDIEKFGEMKDNLLNKYLESNTSITDDIYTKKSQELESKIYELNLQLRQKTNENAELHLTASSLFNLINRLPEVFKSSNPQEKNQILKYLISNSLQTGEKAEFNLKKPFLFLFNNAENQHWFGNRDSNPNSWYQKPKSYH